MLGSIAGTIFTLRTEPSYEVGTSMLVTARTVNGIYSNGTGIPRSEDIYLSQNLAKTVRLLSTSKRVLDRIPAATISPADIKNLLNVSAEEGTSFLRLTLSGLQEDETVLILNFLLEILDIGTVNVIDLAVKAVSVKGKMLLRLIQ